MIRTTLLIMAFLGTSAMACENAKEEKRDVAAEEIEAPAAAEERSFFAPKTVEDIDALASLAAEDFSE